MRQTIKLLVIILALPLAGCMSNEEVKEYFLGSWEGQEGDREWCSTYQMGDDGNILANVYAKSVNQNSEANPATPKYLVYRSEGYLITNRGLRFKLSLGRTHDNDGVEIPVEKRSGRKSYYVVSDHTDDQFRYKSINSEKEFTNTRVDDCERLSKEHLAYLSEIRKNKEHQ